VRFSTARCWIELQEGILESVIKLHNGSLVATSVAIVGRAENGYHILLMTPVVTLHDKLMSPRDKGEAIAVIECLGYVLAERVPSSSGRNTPSTSVIRI